LLGSINIITIFIIYQVKVFNLKYKGENGMIQVCELSKLQEVKAVIDKVHELNGVYELIVNMVDKEKQTEMIDAILDIDTNLLDINSLYGWNQHVKRGNIKNLILEGTVPTEENLRRYQDKVNMEVKKLLEELKPNPVPIIYRNQNNEIISRDYVS
jgi:hypothetical protein